MGKDYAKSVKDFLSGKFVRNRVSFHMPEVNMNMLRNLIDNEIKLHSVDKFFCDQNMMVWGVDVPHGCVDPNIKESASIR